MSDEEARAELRAGWNQAVQHDRWWWQRTAIEIALLPETLDCPKEELTDDC